MDQQVSPVVTETRLEFTGSGSEYFRIWIVNVLLSIVTLGIYSAWAKVKANKYLYSCTRLNGSSFDYHGNPIAILKGRVVALAMIIAYNVAFTSSPILGAVILLLFMAALPWMIWRSLQFKLHNTSYRGVRFGFDGSAGRAYWVYLFLPILAAITLWIFLGPKLHHSLKKFQHTESRYGNRHFDFDATAGSFYKAYYIFFIPLIIGVFIIGVIMAMAGTVLQAAFNLSPQTMPLVVAVLMYAFMLLVLPVFMTMIQNLIWNHTSIGEHRFKSALQWGRMCFITITNLVAIVCTLGLFIPFAKVRMLRYRLESTSMMVAGSLDEFVAETDASVSATGEGVTDLLDFDMSL
jgi:uncharacterized membrane protein YjgN (DUF898 family)